MQRAADGMWRRGRPGLTHGRGAQGRRKTRALDAGPDAGRDEGAPDGSAPSRRRPAPGHLLWVALPIGLLAGHVASGWLGDWPGAFVGGGVAGALASAMAHSLRMRRKRDALS